VAILRDQKGLKDADIGMGNEKAVNQLIAHHAIVFEPKQLKVWVSTAPWQLGEFVAYDLKKVLAMKGLKADQEICDSALIIPADTFLLTEDYKRFVDFRRLKAAFMDKQSIDVEQLVKDNPKYYHTYVIAGDYLFNKKEYKQAEKYYRQALTREIATKAEKDHILQRIKLCGE
jgi:tetratricopeptide (TPR) repeat protein